MNSNRRRVLRFAAALGAAAVLPVGAAAPLEGQVFKSPTCGCCADWIAHLRANGFRVQVTEVAQLEAVRQRYGVPARLASCHTALFGGYVVEGHVPASTIRRLLAEKPGAVGLSVPGMPIGAPGMAGRNAEPFVAVLFDERGRTRRFEAFQPPYAW